MLQTKRIISKNRKFRKEQRLAEEGDGESLRLFYGADMPGDALIHLDTIRAEAKAETPIHLGYGMSVGRPVKNVEASSPAPTRQARDAPKKLVSEGRLRSNGEAARKGPRYAPQRL